ncbi:MAG: response regulator transcription factor [Gammaproteobacteria bacterium]|nr:response regulator transcription factor [Gammaproteobacteria bacterium]MBU0801616.1 response regulator transcription factor [Alphaproteobacteria bacterium]
MNKILIADDHPLIREAIRDVISEAYGDSQFFEVGDFESAFSLALEIQDVDLILLDIGMPGMNGLNGLIELRKELPKIHVAIVTSIRDSQVASQAIAFGASGYITKTSSSIKIIEAIKLIGEGGVYLSSDILHSQAAEAGQYSARVMNEIHLDALTPKQRLVLGHMVKGESNKLIAYNLKLAESTVKSHVSSILRKLDAHNRIQVILSAAGIKFNPYSR